MIKTTQCADVAESGDELFEIMLLQKHEKRRRKRTYEVADSFEAALAVMTALVAKECDHQDNVNGWIAHNMSVGSRLVLVHSPDDEPYDYRVTIGKKKVYTHR